MLIFRIEHKREECMSREYHTTGSSLTGHGPIMSCGRLGPKPNFGTFGSTPEIAMMRHERCAVTISQFLNWITPTYYDYECRNSTPQCRPIWDMDYCIHCRKASIILALPSDWHIVVYEVDNSREGIDWRIDNDQVIFNPAFATKLEKSASIGDIESLISQKISA